MGLPISIQEVVDAISFSSEESTSYLNVDTGEIVVVSEEDRILSEDDEDWDHLADWQRERMPKIQEALESERFHALPTRQDIYEWSIMRDFGASLANERQRELVLAALHGRGAFRNFRRTVRDLGIEDSWNRHRDAALERIARAWLEDHGVLLSLDTV